MDADSLSLYQDLIQICLRETDCRKNLLELASEPATYLERMIQIEQWLDKSENDQPAQGAVESLPDGSCRNLFNLVVSSEPLLALFRQKQRLSGRDPSLVVTLSSLADIHPDPQTTFQTGDQMFMRILPKAVLNLPLGVDDILQADFAKLVRLREINLAAFEELVKLAKWLHWKDLAKLEGFLSELVSSQRSAQGETSGNGVQAPAAQLEPIPMPLALQTKILISQLPEHLRPLGELFLKPADETSSPPNQQLIELFLDQPLFSTILPEEVQLFNEQQGAFTPEQVSFSAYIPKEAPTLQMSGQVAGVGIQNLTDELLADVRRNISIRIDIAQQYLSLREFAKLDVLNFKWPSLADELRKNPEVIKRLEALFIEKAPVPEDLRPLYAEANRDKNLVSFLRLRPLFRDMKELKAKAVAAQVMPEKVEAPEATQMKVAEGIGVSEQAIKEAKPSADLGKEAIQYYNLTLIIRAQKPDMPRYEFELHGADQKEIAVNHIEVDPVEVEKRFQIYLPRLGQMMFTESSRDIKPDLPTTSRVGMTPYGYEQLIKDFGATLYSWFIQGTDPGLENMFLSNLAVHDRLRLLVEIDPNAARLHELPWESLYIPSRDIYLGKDSRYSLVRKILPAYVRNDLLTPMRPPLRVLAILSSPRDMPQINIKGEEQLLNETLQEQVKEGNVELNILLPPITREKLQMGLLRFRPDIFHFVGHGVYDQSKQTGILLVETEDGIARPLDSEDFKELLADQKVRAVVLNGCHTGSAEGSLGVTTSIAGMLVEAGIPLVVATLREILDNAALLFSRTFYTSLATGTVLESALAEARKALKLEGFDWTAYALYTNTDNLDQLLFLPRQTTRTEATPR